MVDVVTGVAAVKTAYELTRNLKAVIDKIGDAEVKIQMAELLSAMAEAKADAAEKAERIVELQKLLSIKEQMRYEDPYYWMEEVNEEKSGPYCQKCLDSDQKTIRLQKEGVGSWRCLECRNYYTDSNYTSPDISGFW